MLIISTLNLFSGPYNRLKLVLAECNKTGKWLSEQLHKDHTTVSKWCINASQPSLATLYQIAEVLDVEVADLLVTRNKL